MPVPCHRRRHSPRTPAR